MTSGARAKPECFIVSTSVPSDAIVWWMSFRRKEAHSADIVEATLPARLKSSNPYASEVMMRIRAT